MLKGQLVDLGTTPTRTVQNLDLLNAHFRVSLAVDMVSGYEKRASILRGAEDEIFSLVRDRATPSQWAEWLAAPLAHAASTGNYVLVDKLLRAGADGNACWRGSCGETLLHAAAEGGSEQVMSAFILAGSDDIDVHTPRGRRRAPLHVAAAGGFQAAAKVLMLTGADVDTCDVYGDCPLHLALEGGHADLAKDLLLGGAQHDVRGYSGHYPIHLAVRSGEDEAVLALVQSRAYLDHYDAEGETPLRLALRADHVSIVEILLAGGADPDFRVSSSWAPLHLAAELNKPAAIPTLVNAGADVDISAFGGLTPLFMAAFHGSYSAMSALLKEGANVDVENNRGWTPLHVACFKGRPDAADLLLRWGADEWLDEYDELPIDLVPVIIEAAVEDRPRLELLRKILQNAPQDRIWRRRGFFVMCRAFSSRVRVAGKVQEVASEAVDQRRVRRSPRARKGGLEADLDGVHDDRGVRAAGSKAGRSKSRARGKAPDGFEGVAASLMALKDGDAFRKIIEFL